jgi:hypothetical protein
VKTDDELKQIAKDIFSHKIFTSTMLREGDERLLSSVFMPVLFMEKEQIEELEKNDVVAFYEYFDEAGPRSVNGYPIFMSANTLTRSEYNRTMEFYKQVKEKMDSI